MSDFVPNSKVCGGTVLSQDNFNALMNGDSSPIDPSSLLISQLTSADFMYPV